MATKTQRLKRLATLSAKAHDAQRKADAALAERDAAVAEARHRDDPATYQEIADAMGVTKDRVSQIVQRLKRAA